MCVRVETLVLSRFTKWEHGSRSEEFTIFWKESETSLNIWLVSGISMFIPWIHGVGLVSSLGVKFNFFSGGTDLSYFIYWILMDTIFWNLNYFLFFFLVVIDVVEITFSLLYIHCTNRSDFGNFHNRFCLQYLQASIICEAAQSALFKFLEAVVAVALVSSFT